MATAAEYAIRIDQGATFSETFRLEDDDVGRNLDGYTIYLKAAVDLDDTDLEIDISSAGSEITIGGNQDVAATAGYFTITIPAATTTAYTFTTLRYSLTVESAGGVIDRILEGALSLSKGVIGS